MAICLLSQRLAGELSSLRAGTCQNIDTGSGGSPTGSGRTTSGSGQTAASTKAVGNSASESPLATDATDAGFSADLRAAIALHERAALGD